MKEIILLVLFVFTLQVKAKTYPSSWWKQIPRNLAKSWEILPQEAKTGEVILSKRTELGVFSNLARTPFLFENKSYQSIESLWQMLKYPDTLIENDLRKYSKKWKYNRLQVRQLSGFDSKKAGNHANKILKNLNINWVSYMGHQFNYKDHSKGSLFHYTLIKKATIQKITQNPILKKLLIRTKGLILKADHKRKNDLPKSYYYEDILMEIRDYIL